MQVTSVGDSGRGHTTRSFGQAQASLNQFITVAVAEQVSAYQTAAFFAQRAGHAQPGDLAELLKPLPDRPPVKGDELPG